jgi:hypothetical protein
MMRSRILQAAVASALVAAAAPAQPMLQRGTQELAVHVSIDFEGAVGDTITADAGWGWFVRDALELRASLAYAILEDVAAEDSDFRTRQLAGGFEYHFRRAHELVPYLGLELGWRATEFSDVTRSGLVYGPRGGVKIFLADNVALDFEVVYLLAGDDVFVNDFAIEDTDLSTAIGLRVLF